MFLDMTFVKELLFVFSVHQRAGWKSGPCFILRRNDCEDSVDTETTKEIKNTAHIIDDPSPNHIFFHSDTCENYVKVKQIEKNLFLYLIKQT